VRTPILRWLSFRIRILCGVILLISSILPPFVPRAALSADENAVPASQFLLVEDGFLMKSSTIGEQASRLAFSDVIIHKVKNGETIGDIARQYNISVDTLMTVNNMQAGTSVQPDQELLILPVDGVLHIVRPGQKLARISELYGVSQDVISRQNNIRGSFIVAGQQLIIPGAKPIGGMVPAIAAIQESTGDSGLHFTDKLPSKDIQLQLKQAEQEGRRPTAGSSVKNAPAVSVEPTTGILQMPCNNCFITQYFHAGHYALDIQTRGGGPVFAAEAGTVIRADSGGWNGGYGNVIEIDHGNGLVTLYAHNRELYVKVGDQVTRGQTIAWMGNTGLVYGATGIHTHFEVRVNGDKKNPILYLE
jgi:murein DD-endopeptidase MepM/ murein hydrolase activator NlpD